MDQVLEALQYIYTLTPPANQLGMSEFYRIKRDVLVQVIEYLKRMLEDLEENTMMNDYI